MKRITIAFLFICILYGNGCANQMIDKEGTDWSRYGRLVDWASPWHGGTETIDPQPPQEPEQPVVEPDANPRPNGSPYTGVAFTRPSHAPKNEVYIEYTDNIPQTWLQDPSPWLREFNVKEITYPEYPDYKEYDISQTTWGAGESHMIRTMREFEENRRNYKLIVFQRDGKTIVGKFKSYNDRIE